MEVRTVADDVGDVPGIDVREALPRHERAGGRPVTAVAEARSWPGASLVGDAV